MQLQSQGPRSTEKQPPVDIEVLLDYMEEKHLSIRLDEQSQPIRIPRYGVKIRGVKGGYAVLSMSEHCAITYNLV